MGGHKNVQYILSFIAVMSICDILQKRLRLDESTVYLCKACVVRNQYVPYVPFISNNKSTTGQKVGRTMGHVEYSYYFSDVVEQCASF